MLLKLKDKLWNQVYETVIDKTYTQSTVILTGSPFMQHPPLVNWRCHHNSAWYLKNNENVVAVAKGFYIDTSGNNPIAHFVCLDSLGNWFAQHYHWNILKIRSSIFIQYLNPQSTLIARMLQSI